jgi:hypothetical protein
LKPLNRIPESAAQVREYERAHPEIERYEGPVPEMPPPVNSFMDEPPSVEELMAEGKIGFGVKKPVESAAPEKQCSYTEFVPETGETYRCALPEHGRKVRHQIGDRVA